MECPGHSCKVREATGLPYCKGSCSVNNGGCRTDQQCSVKRHPCVHDDLDIPCPPPRVVCTDIDSDPCEICEPDSLCVLEPVPCLIPPCPVEAKCLEPKCGLKADPGPCEAAIARYFFNTKTGACEDFIYGGCLGNANNFETLDECAKACNCEYLWDLLPVFHLGLESPPPLKLKFTPPT